MRQVQGHPELHKNVSKSKQKKVSVLNMYRQNHIKIIWQHCIVSRIISNLESVKVYGRG